MTAASRATRTRRRGAKAVHRTGRRAALPLASASVDRLDALFKGFADPTRLRLLNLLAAGELCVCDLVDLVALPQPTVSRHLAYLRRSGLVAMSRQWKFVHYRLADPAHPVHATLLGCVRSCFDGIPSLDAERAAAAARVAARTSDAENACRGSGFPIGDRAP